MNITPFLACWYIGTFALEAKCLFFGQSLSRGDYLTISRLRRLIVLI